MNQDADQDLKNYIKCMTNGYPESCYRIECNHGLDGYTPELAMIGLKAISDGLDPHAEIESYMKDIAAE